jgi:hypothetical protein
VLGAVGALVMTKAITTYVQPPRTVCEVQLVSVRFWDLNNSTLTDVLPHKSQLEEIVDVLTSYGFQLSGVKVRFLKLKGGMSWCYALDIFVTGSG